MDAVTGTLWGAGMALVGVGVTALTTYLVAKRNNRTSQEVATITRETAFTDDLQAELKEFRVMLKEHKKDIFDLQQKNIELSADIAKYKARIEILEDQRKAAKEAVEDAEKRIKLNESQIIQIRDDARTKAQEYQETINELHDENVRLRTDLNSLRVVHDTIVTEYAEFRRMTKSSTNSDASGTSFYESTQTSSSTSIEVDDSEVNS